MIAADDTPVLDGVAWQAEANASLYGVCLGLRVTNAEHLATLVRHMPHGAVAAAGQRVDRMYSAVVRSTLQGRVYQLFVGQRRIAQRPDLERLAHAFAASSRHFVAAHAHGRVFIHAGVVAYDDQAIVIPGRTLTGKTTLVAELVRAGATYYSDEYAVLDERGWVHPFAKPLSMRTGAGQPQTLVDVRTLGGRSGSVPLRIGALLVTQYVAGVRWQPESLSPGQAALSLLDNAVAARSRFSEVRKAISAAVGGGIRAWHGIRGEAQHVARWTLEQIEGE